MNKIKIILVVLIVFFFKIECQALVIKDFYGKTIQVDNYNIKVVDLKRKISDYFKVKSLDQEQYLNGIPLKNGQQLTTISKNSTIYLYNKKDNYIYPIVIFKKGQGQVKVDNKYKVSSIVYLDIKPEEGYYLDKITVKDFEGKKITVEDNRFTMPFGLVKIEVIFENDIQKASALVYPKESKNNLIPFLIFILCLILSLKFQKCSKR